MKLKYKLCIALLFASISTQLLAVEEVSSNLVKPSNVINHLSERLTDEQIQDQAQIAADKGDWKQVYELLLPLAQKGNAIAQVNLGIMYFSGRYVEKDLYQAYWWFNEAGAQGSAKAITYIGLMYLDGAGVKKDIKHAIKILEQAGKVNYPSAMLALGNAYYMQKDLHASFLWFERAAMKGVSEAQFKLGMMYEKGEGTVKNKKQAIYWYQTTLKANDKIARYAQERLSALEN
ncbi:tetratricopeptide repeat protein [Mannheimia massilioguelmaensis]|uniref:tetratricopeptide repeat protein n=1 Tax=Mannheimia massilioguelmaensis TaxID=1604354 RepID=UPI0005C8AC9F|nr:tetratricopeptide repeat protein [Mannheimia massilioguelmaensis]